MIHDGLYTVLKRIEWLRSAVRKWRNIVERARIDVWVISGSERRGGHALTVLIAGQLETKNYLAELLFKEPFSETHHRMWRSRLQGEAAARGYGHAIAFVDTETPRSDGSANKRRVFKLRGWVRTELDLGYAAERIRCSSSIRKTDVRKIRKNGLIYDTTTDPQELERFYWDMYVPYAQQEFGGKAIYMSYVEFRAGLKNPELLRVHKDGQVVAGMIILHHENDRPQWWILGMQNGDRELMKQGAMAALYLYGIEHLTERGYSRALLGGARPFLVDGVLQYKRKWGARLLAGDDGDPHWLTVTVVESTKGVRDFLEACPLIGEDEHGLVGQVFFDGADFGEGERIRGQAAELAALGIARVRAIEFLPVVERSGHVLSEVQETVDLASARGRKPLGRVPTVYPEAWYPLGTKHEMHVASFGSGDGKKDGLTIERATARELNAVGSTTGFEGGEVMRESNRLRKDVPTPAGTGIGIVQREAKSMRAGTELGLRSVGLAENPYRSLFRCNQFVLGPAFAPGVEDWTQVILGPRLKLTAHPGLNVVQVGSGAKRLSVLGVLLDPLAPEMNDRQILEKLLDRFESLDSLIAATGPLGGRWTIVAVDGNEAHLFSDAFGLRQVFYTQLGVSGEVFATSEAALGAVMLNTPVDDAARVYMDSEIFRAEREYKWPLSASAFCGIRRLLPNHVLDLRRGVSRRFWPQDRLKDLSVEIVVERTAPLLRGVMRAAANRYDLAVSVTCGIDSRVVLAACRDIVDRASFVTVRQWHMSDTSPDIAIPATLLAKLGLDHEVILAPVTMTPEFGQMFKSSAYLAHDHYGPDAQAIFERFGRTRVAITGSGAEVARCGGRERLPFFDRKRASAAYLARLEMGGRNEFVERYFSDWLRDTGDRHNINIVDLFEWEQSCGSWLAATQLEFDVAWKDVVTPFNCREVMTLMLSAPPQYRKGLAPPLFKRLIRELWPQALDAPINPHKQPWLLTKYLHAPLELLRHAAHLFRYR